MCVFVWAFGNFVRVLVGLNSICITCITIAFPPRGKEPGIAVEKFLRKTRELDSYGAKFNLIRVLHFIPVNVYSEMYCTL